MIKRKCNCPCHEKGVVVMHFMPCCSGEPDPLTPDHADYDASGKTHRIWEPGE